MANPLRNEFEWTVNGRLYTLRLSIGDLVSLDNAEEGKQGYQALITRITSRTSGVNDLTAVLMRALKTGGKITLRREEIWELIDEAGIEDTTDAVIGVLSKRLVKDKPEERSVSEEDETDPPLSGKHTGSDLQ